MGKHKNIIALNFLALLRERGKMYNFVVEEEYPLIKGKFFADMVYKLASEQLPIVSFEVETRPTSYVIKNAVKYFSTTSIETPKPWHHFILILSGNLRPSDKTALERITEKHNVYIFENLLSDDEENERFNIMLSEICRGFKRIEERKNVSKEFQIGFSAILDACLGLIEKHRFSKISDTVDELISLFKERIEKWDVPSVRFATKEVFEKLYKYSENDFCELYTIYKDLFMYAYSQRRQLIGAMIAPFFDILLMAWIEGYDIEKGEKASRVLLRLGIDFIEKDLAISEDCIHGIDNLAGDMFEPEILSKEIIFCASAYQKSNGKERLQDFVETYSDWIRINEEYSWDDGTKSYLRDAIKYAEWEQDRYGVDIESYKNNVLLPFYDSLIDSQIIEYADFLEELLGEGDDINDNSYPAEDLSQMILAYETHRPRFAEEIRKKILKTGKHQIIELFERIITNSNFLTKVYKGSEMITTFDELIKFIETSSDKERLGVGITTFGIAIINFDSKLKEGEKDKLQSILREYQLEDADVTDDSITFEIDPWIYSKGGKQKTEKLVSLLKELNSIFKLKAFSTGIDFNLREK